jgi:hypothetical protein
VVEAARAVGKSRQGETTKKGMICDAIQSDGVVDTSSIGTWAISKIVDTSARPDDGCRALVMR